MDPNRGFWHHFAVHVNDEHAFAGPRFSAFMHHQANRSNSPEIESLLAELDQRVLPEWQGKLRNIFVGRTLAGDVNAEAWQKDKAGTVELSIQLTVVLGAYVNAYDRYIGAMRQVLTIVQSEGPGKQQHLDEVDRREFGDWWDQLDAIAPSWADASQFVGVPSELLRPPDFRKDDSQARVAEAAETFVICHELAHHLLGHTSKAGANRSTREWLAAEVVALGLDQQLAAQKAGPRRELEADFLAFLLVADAVQRKPNLGTMTEALLGGGIALLAIAHCSRHWTRPSETHPPMTVRLGFMCELAEALSADMPPQDESGAHPIDLSNQLVCFASAALQHQAHLSDPENFDNAVGMVLLTHFLELRDGLRARFPSMLDPAVKH